MLQIRPEQFEVLQRAQLERFLREAEQHVMEYWPDLAAERGEDGVRELVDRASTRCDELGIGDEYDVLRYLNLICHFGESFEGELPWAGPLLGDLARPGRDRLDEAMRLATGDDGAGDGDTA